MDELKLTGRVTAIYDEEQVTEKFSKREFIVETPGDYPVKVKFECTNAKTAILDKVNEGDTVTVSFNFRHNEYKGKLYNSQQAWKIA